MRIACAVVVVLAAEAAAAPVLTFQADPHPGIHRETWTDATIPAVIRLVRIDLTSAGIALYATKQADRGHTTSAYSNSLTAQVAINGDSFSVAGYVPTGLAMGESVVWSNTADDAKSAVLDFRRVGERTVAEIVPPEVIVTPDSLPSGAQGVVSGRPLLVRSGAPETQFDCSDPLTIACERAPRAAAALSADGNTLWVITVDGWQQSSLGLTAAELAAFLQARGADMALALDGGSSATLVVDGTLISSPSDGVERTVANQLAVKYGSLPSGQLVGLICKKDVFACSGDPNVYLAGATVTLDDGRSQQSQANGFYDFTGVTPRLACVTAKLTGYYTKTQCQYVTSMGTDYNSIALFPCTGSCVQQDAGVDAPARSPDAAGSRDAQPGDGGNAQTGPGGGCCGAGRDRPEVALFVLVAWFLTRRRGTTVPGT